MKVRKMGLRRLSVTAYSENESCKSQKEKTQNPSPKVVRNVGINALSSEKHCVSPLSAVKISRIFPARIYEYTGFDDDT